MNTPDAPSGWQSISELSRTLQLDKSAVSRRVSRLAASGLLTCRQHGKLKLVNVEEFRTAVATAGHAINEANARASIAPTESALAASPGDPILAREQAKRAAHQAEMARLDLEERLGKLVKAEAVRASVEALAVELVRVIDALPGRADGLAAAMTKEGVSGLRAGLRAFARELREALARAAEDFGDGEDLAEDEAPSAGEPSALTAGPPLADTGPRPAYASGELWT